jgi:hypothetical protein
MKNIFRTLFAALLIVSAVIPGKAEMVKNVQSGSKGQRAQTAAGCTPSSSYDWLDINNVRTRINSGGDMWWDLPAGTGSKYFIPANGSATSLFAGSLWIAGVDVNNQLKCAALRFRQVGNDYYTGPLTVDGRASITPETCAKWDKIFKITRAEVDEFLANVDYSGSEPKLKDGYEVPSIIKNWPATRADDDPEGIAYYLAPFYDANGDGEYDPEKGDYPYYDINNELCHTKIPTMEEEFHGTVHGSILADQVLKGDQTLWWIFNDKGASHTESSGQAIGIEVRAQAFAFATNDEINNMTFYSYEIINRSTYTLTGTYFSPWTDVDLGYGWDDYVGCDVARGLGYGYNGSAVDGSGEPEAYGAQPPAIGIDFFQGPYMDPDGIDNPKYTFDIESSFSHIDPATGDSIFVYDTTGYHQVVDESINGVNFGNGIVDDERFGMRRFVYHNNANTDNGDPDTAPEYYNYLRGIWKNGAKMRYGGNAFSGSDVVGPECDFMFPGDSDPWNWGTNGTPPNGNYNTNGKYWSEEQCQNAPNDRRFMQSAGPFTLEPGAVNYITFGVPWARATSGGAWASVELLRVVDDKCQALFDNCFKVIDGPSAPDLTIRELDQQLIVYLSNAALSNNYKEGYLELDPEIPEGRVDTEVKFDSIQVITIDGDTVYTVTQHEEKIETIYDRYYRFEGYKVYQLANAEVGADELSNTDKARLVFQCDVRNNVATLINYEYDESLQANVPVRKVVGGDAGITHSFVLTQDQFAQGDNPNLVNHNTYYYMAVAYAYNNYLTYSQDPSDPFGLLGQKKPYLEGRKNIQVYSAVPHKTINGTVLRASYGDSPAITRIVGVGNGGNELELSQATIDEILSKPMASETNRFGSPDYPIAYHPTYEPGYGPINVKIIDPLNVQSHRYELYFDDMFEQYTHNISGNPDVRGDSAMRMASHWWLLDLDTNDTLRADTTSVYDNEQMFIDRGISITIAQTYNIGRVKIGQYYAVPSGGTPGSQYEENWHDFDAVIAPNNGVITSSMEFQKPDSVWMDGIRDVDVPGLSLNWIRSGSYSSIDNPADNDHNCSAATSTLITNLPWDPNENFEKLAGRTWAPANLTSYWKQGSNFNPGPLFEGGSRSDQDFKDVCSVDIVFTTDKSKWTRCPVLEMGLDKNLNEGGADRFFLRRHPSVDKDGKPYANNWNCKGNELVVDNNPADPNADGFVYASTNPDDPNFISPQGMGWFPGYVIDVETGMRLNVAFGEDSYLEDMGGRDMLFNPAKLLKTTVDDNSGLSQTLDPAVFRGANSDPVFGGKHFVYIWRADSIVMSNTSPYKDVKNYGYDGGQLLFNTLNYIQNVPQTGVQRNLNIYFYKLLMYVGMPMGIEGMKWLPEGNDCRIRIRLAKPYDAGYGNHIKTGGGLPNAYGAGYGLQTYDPALDINNYNPKFAFSIDGWDPIQNDPEKTEKDLNLVTVVPNPYYAYDSYEGNALTNKVKITNLPNKCVVTIYTLSGTKVRQFRKDNEEPSIEWDLTNFANTPVASGFYLIHIKDLTSNSERTIKFFGAMRQVDLNTF